MKSSGQQATSSHKGASETSTQETLLSALQNFIIPLIGGTDQTVEKSGPEAGKLIVALQEFVASIIVHSESKAKRVIELDLPDEEIEPAPRVAQHGIGDDDKITIDGGDVQTNRPESLDKPPSAYQDKLLSALRERVFNTMPIRLLCFEPHGSSFQISLIERGAIHARLASAIVENMHLEDHHPQYIDWRHYKKETDEQAINRVIRKYTAYAILSHTWLSMPSAEIGYGDWKKGRFDVNDPGYQKLVNFCAMAWRKHGLSFGWMDTVCINKESSSELDESIRSMYAWYQRAYVCIVYLAETRTISDMHADLWFTRGWTLQELLAPERIEFYNAKWNRLVEDEVNHKNNGNIVEQIQQATSITQDELHDICSAPISRRMQLAATRKVTREEDTAYSLMGIFQVSFSTAYGEGAEHAFSRLLQEILVSYPDVLDIFNWAGQLEGRSRQLHNSNFLLPSSPKNYLLRSSSARLSLPFPMEPLTLTHLGLRIPVVLIPGLSISTSPYDPTGEFSGIANIFPIYSDAFPSAYHLLDKRIRGKDGERKDRSGHQITFAVFNVRSVSIGVAIPMTCIAKALVCFEDVGKVTPLGYRTAVDTTVPILFDLFRKKEKDITVPNDEVNNEIFTVNGEYWVASHAVAKHGMQQVSLYM